MFFSGFTFAQKKDKVKETGTLTVVINGFKTDKGVVKILLCNTEESYTNSEKQKGFMAVNTVIKDEKLSIFKAIPFGDYTIQPFRMRTVMRN